MFKQSTKQFLLVVNNNGNILVFEQVSREEYVKRQSIKVDHKDYGYMQLSGDHSRLFLSPLHGCIMIYDMQGFPDIKLIQKTSIKAYSMFDKSFDLLGNCETIFSTLDHSDNVSYSESIRKKKIMLQRSHTQLVYTSKVGKMINKLFTGSYDNSVRIWSLFSRKKVGEITKHHGNWISVLDLLENEKYLVSAGFDKFLKVFNVDQRKLVRSLELGNGSLYALKVVEKEGIVCLGGSDKFKMNVVEIGDLLEEECDSKEDEKEKEKEKE